MISVGGLLLNSKKPLVSVVIPTCNRAPLVGRAIRSVLAQTFQDWELFVVDDGSEDNTQQVVLGFQDARIFYLCHGANRGPSAARNTGIRASRGEYMAFLDDDDEWLPEKLEKELEVFRSSPAEVGVVYTGCIQTAADGSKRTVLPVDRGWISERLWRGKARILWYAQTLMCRRETLVAIGGFDEALPAKEDADLWYRLAKVCAVGYVREPLVVVSTSAPDRISSNVDRQIRAGAMLLEKYADEYRDNPQALAHRLMDLGDLHFSKGELKVGSRYYLRSVKTAPVFAVKGLGVSRILRLILSVTPFIYWHAVALRRKLRGHGGNRSGNACMRELDMK